MLSFALSLPLPVKVLLFNNLGFNVGFYMLLPYLTRHLTEDLGLSAAFAGFVMGFRMLSQQGLFLIGGTLADRFNYQTVILAGCALRVLGFGLFGVAFHPWAIVGAAFLTGFAGALFTPAYQAFLARLTEGHPERESVYALQNVTSQAGALAGPLCGLVLLRYGFSTLCAVAAAVFFLLLLLQWFHLPRLEGTERSSSLPVLTDWVAVFRKRDFLIFCLLMSAYYLMFNQLYLLLPLSSPNDGSVAALFTLSALLSVALQMPLSRFVVGRFSRPLRLTAGMGLMALAFPFLLLRAGTVGPVSVNTLVTTTLLTLGMMIVFPPALSMIPEMGGERRQGICFGVFYLFAGVAGASGGALTAWLWELHPLSLIGGLTLAGLTAAALLGRHGATSERASRERTAVPQSPA